uniref:HTH_Tnp_Tc3_1 domain-containing protein n=1 Tax=Heterorhabditis bacteriophora TaxID=37862 RepID=A0A1I7XIV4_HETBA
MPFVGQYRKPKMTRGSLINDIEKEKILTFSDAGLKQTEIAREIGRSRNVVANFLRAPASLDEIRSIYCSTVSKATLLEGTEGKSIHQVGKNEEVSHVNSRSQESQDGFCPCTHVIGLRNGLSLDGPDGFTSYWRDLIKERRFFYTPKFECGSLMVGAAFSSFGAIELAFVSPKMNSVDYQQVLENRLFPYYNRFQQKTSYFNKTTLSSTIDAFTMDVTCDESVARTKKYLELQTLKYGGNDVQGAPKVLIQNADALKLAYIT